MMDEQSIKQTAYDIFQTILSTNRHLGKPNTSSVGEIQRFLNSGASKKEIISWVMCGLAVGKMRPILGMK